MLRVKPNLNFLIPVNFRENKIFVFNILKWTLIGLLIRVIIMPFSMDSDIQWINYLPHRLVAYGNWDAYTFAKDNFAEKVLVTRDPYYPPLTLYLISFFQFMLQKFMPTLKEWFFHFEDWFRLGAGYPLQRIALAGSSQLFRILFLLKIPLLFFDFGIGFILIRLVRNIKEAYFVYKLWMLNIVVLYATYATGQIDIYPTFFVVLAVFFSLKNKLNLAMVSLGLGAALKSYPLILIPVAAFYLGKDLKHTFKLLSISIITFVFVFLPSLISSRGYSLVSIYYGSIGTSVGSKSVFLLIMKFLFLLGFIYILFHIHRQNRLMQKSFSLESYFFITLLLLFIFQPIAVRFYIWITPFVIMQFMRDKNFWKPTLIQLLTLFELRLCDPILCAGIFAPLHYAFATLPIPDTFISPFFNILYVHKFMYRLFILSTVYMLYRSWKKSNLNGKGSYVLE